MDGIQIVLLIIIVLALIAIYYSSTYNKIKTEILKINSSESEIDTLLRNKYDLIAKVIVEINQPDDKNLKTFDKLKEEDGMLKASFKDLSDDLKEFVNKGKYKKISVF